MIPSFRPIRLLTLVIPALLGGLVALPGAAGEDAIRIRDGLPRLAAALQAGRPVHVAFLGGSITENTTGHTAMVPEWLEETWPDARFVFTNAGISSTGSTTGAFRLANDVLSTGRGPVDLLVVEFAVNDDQDGQHAHRDCVRGMEGIVRHLRRAAPGTDLVMVHFVNPPILEKLSRGETPVSIAAHEAVAERYGVTSANVAAAVAKAVAAGEFTWDQYGGTHPKPFGYRFASDRIIEAIKGGLEAATPAGEPTILPEPLDPFSYDAGELVAVDRAELSGASWKTGKVSRELLPLGSIRDRFLEDDVLRADEPGTALRLPFRGRGVGAFVLAGPDAGIVETRVDEGAWTRHDLFHHFSRGLNYPRSVVFAAELGDGDHVLELKVAAEANPASKGTAATILFLETNGPAAGTGGLQAAPASVKHSFFIAGPTFTGILDEDGREAWNAGKPGARDGFILPNGNALIAWADEVKEITRAGEVVLHFPKREGVREIGTVQRLADGNTLVTELGPKPRLLEVAPDGSVVVEVPLQPETDNAHMQTRMARKLPNGNYLVPHLLAFKVKEYTPAGEVVRAFATDLPELGGREAENWPFTAIRLADGNTLVTLTHGNKVVEMDPEGRVVWKLSNEDFPDLAPFADPCGAQRLPSGNTVIASYGSKRPVKVFEVTPDKRLVWRYEGEHRAHEIQVLTTNGMPVEGEPMK